jgi:c(7)-type cytochrome triheme protein
MRVPRRCRRFLRFGVTALATVALGLALAGAQSRPGLKLPPDFLFPAKDSPGPVLFSHRSHVNLERPNCTTCHPRLFSILRPGTPADGLPMGHDQMQRGEQCGACHNGKAAFAPTAADKCVACHRAGGS